MKTNNSAPKNIQNIFVALSYTKNNFTCIRTLTSNVENPTGGFGSPMLVIITDMPFTRDLSLIPKLCSSSPLSNSDTWIRSTSCLKTRLAINMFGPLGRLLVLGRIITLRALASKRKQNISASHVLFNIARQHGPLGPDTAIWACLTVSNHEIHEYSSCDGTCSPRDLSTRDNNKHSVHTGSFLHT